MRPQRDSREFAGRRFQCDCGKVRYRTEQDAQKAANRDHNTHGGVITTYRCPGGLAWHVTSKGFLPESLRTIGRRLAYELLMHDQVDLDDFRRRVLRLSPDDRAWRRVRQYAKEMTAAGLAAEAETGEGRKSGLFSPVDRDGLKRVVQVGLDTYLAEREA